MAAAAAPFCLGVVVLAGLVPLAALPAQQPGWTPLRPLAIEADDHARPTLLAADEARGAIVSFGCHPSDAVVADTWVWAGSHWSPRDPARQPQRRTDALFAFDRARQRVVMFGGTTAAGQTDETWEWDGSTWQLRPFAVRPLARGECSGAYDAARRRVVLYGGRSAGQHLADTWDYDGTAWTLRSAASAPGTRFGHRMAYDEARQRIVLHGGRNQVWAYMATTWEWDGATWQLGVVNGPPCGDQASMVYDRLRQRTLLWGWPAGLSGFAPGGYEWDGSTWTFATATPPLSISPEALATDPHTGQALRFAGGQQWRWTGAGWLASGAVATTPGSELGRLPFAADTVRQRVVAYVQDEGTWEWDGASWSRRGTGPWLSYSALAFDRARQRTVMFGGTGSYLSSSTFEWDGATWTQRNPAVRPPARYLATMAYDDARQQVVLFGGVGATTTPGPPPVYGDTWTYDGSAWTQRGAGPAARFGHAMAGDPLRQVVVLHGGGSYFGSTPNDTWEWQGTAWQLRTPPTSPPARSHAGLAFDPSRGAVVLCGGFGAAGALGDTWSYDGTQWTPLAVSPGLTPRGGLGLAYDPVQQRLLAYGGYTTGNPVAAIRISEWLTAAPVAPQAVVVGSGCASGSGPAPTLRAPLPYLGHRDFALEIAGAAPGAACFVGFAAGLQPQPLGPCTLYLPGGAAVLAAVVANGFGIAQLPLAVPELPALAGFGIAAQAVVLAAPGAYLGVDFTAALDLRVGH